jgi:hypothetical protein
MTFENSTIPLDAAVVDDDAGNKSGFVTFNILTIIITKTVRIFDYNAANLRLDKTSSGALPQELLLSFSVVKLASLSAVSLSN